MFEFPVPELWNLPERRGWTEPWRAAAPAGECAVIDRTRLTEANPEKKTGENWGRRA